MSISISRPFKIHAGEKASYIAQNLSHFVYARARGTDVEVHPDSNNPVPLQALVTLYSPGMLFSSATFPGLNSLVQKEHGEAVSAAAKKNGQGNKSSGARMVPKTP